MKIALAIVIAVLAAAPSAAEQFTTGPLMNGRGWNAMSEMEQSVFVRGMAEALMFSDAICKHEEIAKLMVPKATPSEIRKGVTLIYNDPANIGIPIIWAMQVYAMRVAGRSEEDVNGALLEHRSNAYKKIQR